MLAALSIAARVVAVVGGGYAATVGGVALLAAAAVLLRMERSEAVLLTSMIGFIGYTVVILWGFAERRVWLVWAWLGGAAVGSHLLAWWLIRLGAGA